MPRTIEGIVAAHRAASERRAAGKPSWKGTIDLRAIVKQDQNTDDAAVIAGKAHAIAKLFRSRLSANRFDPTHDDYDEDLTEVIENLETYNAEELAKDSGESRQDMINGHLDELYDWADRERYWLG